MNVLNWQSFLFVINVAHHTNGKDSYQNIEAFNGAETLS